MPRIPLPDTFDDEQRALLARSLPGPDGEPLNVFKTLVGYPELMRRVNALGGYFLVAGELELRTRELVILRVAGTVGSVYELAQHRWISRRAGMDAAEVEAAAAPGTAWEWDDAEKALLAAVDELLARDVVGEGAWAGLREHFSEQQVVELVVLVGFYRMLAGVLASLDVEVDEPVRRVLDNLPSASD